MSQISVIVLNWNGKHFLRECLDSLRDQTFKEFETILVDNGSTDGSVEYVKECFPEVEVIALPANVGFAEGNNIGIRASKGEYVALLNNDTRADRNWLEALKTALDSHDDVGSCASKMLFYDRPDVINAVGDVYYSCGVASQRGCMQRDGEDFSRRQYVFGACAGAAMYRRAMLEDVGLFDEDFFAYNEDVDLSFRAQLMGYKCLFVPESIVYHHSGGTSGHDWGMAFYLTRRNSMDVVIKNLPGALLIRNLPLILFHHLGGDLWHIFNGRGYETMKSRIENLTNLRKTLRKRRQVQRRRRVSTHYIASLLVSGRTVEKIRFDLEYLATGATVGLSKHGRT